MNFDFVYLYIFTIRQTSRASRQDLLNAPREPLNVGQVLLGFSLVVAAPDVFPGKGDAVVFDSCEELESGLVHLVFDKLEVPAQTQASNS